MLRALIPFILIASLGPSTFQASTTRSAPGRTADHHPLLVEGASPRFAIVAMTIL